MITVKEGAEPTSEDLHKQMTERRPLPLGRKEFMEWTDRIISGAGLLADVRSQRFVLSDLLLHLGPQEDHKEDAFFIHSMRKFAVNQVAIAMRDELKAEQKAELAAKEAADKAEAEAKATIADPEAWNKA